MKTTIPNKYTALQKVIDCINSCTDFRQINSADHLIRNFYNMYHDWEVDKFLIEKSYDRMAEIGKQL